MIVPSPQFILFGILVALAYNAFHATWWRQSVLLIGSFAFLATYWQGAVAALPLFGFLAFGWIGMEILRSIDRRSVFWAYLSAILLLFFWLKQYVFLALVPFLAFPYVTIGLSYIFFRVVHLIIDTYEGSLPTRPSVVSYLNYTLNFTTLVSGPIQRYEDFAAQQLSRIQLSLTVSDVGRAMERVVVGFFKVVLVGPILLRFHETSLAAMGPESDLMMRLVWLGTAGVAYTFYLYANFSGYTDVVIGLARFLRFELPENFNRPFSAPNFMDFWARWHMTLSNWFKTYVYNPLIRILMVRYPSPKVEPFLGVIAFFVTFFLVGLWHGRTSIFIVFGLMLGLGVSVNKLYQVLMIRRMGRKGYRQLASHDVYIAVARGLTFSWLILCVVAFWADWPLLGEISSQIGAGGFAVLAALMVLTTSVVLAAYEWLRSKALSVKYRDSPVLSSRYVRTALCTALAALSVAALLVTAGAPPDVVYKTF